MKFDAKGTSLKNLENLKEFKETYKFLEELENQGINISARLGLELLHSKNLFDENYIISDGALEAYAKTSNVNFKDLIDSGFITPQSSILDLGGNYGYLDMVLSERFECECFVVDEDPLVIKLGKLIKQDWFSLSKERLDIKYMEGDAFKLNFNRTVDYTIISNVISSFRKDPDFGSDIGLVNLPSLSPNIFVNSKNLIVHLPRGNNFLKRSEEYYESQIENMFDVWGKGAPQRYKDWIIFHKPNMLII